MLGGALLAGTFFAGCSTYDELDEPMSEQNATVEAAPLYVQAHTPDGDAMMVLGNAMPIPYSVQNMAAAYQNLRLSGAPLPPMNIRTTHRYVKFTPNAQQYETLMNNTQIEFYNYPLDREVLSEGIYYDPATPGGIPALYAVVNATWTMPNVPYVVLESLYHPQIEDPAGLVSAEGTPAFWEAFRSVEMRSFELTGHHEKIGALLGWNPSGTVNAWEDMAHRQIPLEGVKVRIGKWWGSKSTVVTTNASGVFWRPELIGPARYTILWENEYSSIREGDLLRPAYHNFEPVGVSWDVLIDGGKTLRYAHVHRGLHRYRHTNFPGAGATGMKYTVRYRHSTNPRGIDGTLCMAQRLSPMDFPGPLFDIYKTNSSGDLSTIGIYGATVHQLAHLSHLYQFMFQPGVPLGNPNNHILEGWACFAEKMLITEAYVPLLGQNAFMALIRYYDPALMDYRLFEMPNTYNKQDWTPWVAHNEYCPLFIDLYDDSNQRMGGRYLGISNYMGYVNDAIHIEDLDMMWHIVQNSKTMNDIMVFVYFMSTRFGFQLQDVDNFFSSYPQY